MDLASNDSDYLDPQKFVEYWANLAKTDPTRFEQERLAEIERVIACAKPERQDNLRKLQWRIDMERERAKNPVDAMLRLNKMMWDKFYGEQGFIVAVNMLKGASKELANLTKPRTIEGEATVISFKNVE